MVFRDLNHEDVASDSCSDTKRNLFSKNHKCFMKSFYSSKLQKMSVAERNGWSTGLIACKVWIFYACSLEYVCSSTLCIVEGGICKLRLHLRRDSCELHTKGPCTPLISTALVVARLDRVCLWRPPVLMNLLFHSRIDGLLGAVLYVAWKLLGVWSDLFYVNHATHPAFSGGVDIFGFTMKIKVINNYKYNNLYIKIPLRCL
jgi:hypothetical protein